MVSSTAFPLVVYEKKGLAIFVARFKLNTLVNAFFSRNFEFFPFLPFFPPFSFYIPFSFLPGGEECRSLRAWKLHGPYIRLSNEAHETAMIFAQVGRKTR